MLMRVLFIVVIGLLAVGCSPRPAGYVPPPDENTGLPRLYAGNLESEAAFEAFSVQVAGERFTKFIIDLRSDELLFFDVNLYPMHVDFVMEEVYRTTKTYQATVDYNRNYEADKPEFLLCYLVYHTELDLWTFSFWEGDKMGPDHVRHVYRKLKASFFAGERVQFRPDSTLHETVAEQAPDVPSITNDAIYRQTSYHAFTTGQSTGRLRIVRDASEAFTFADDEIIIVTVPLPDLTAVSGIISEEFSTPLSHVALRARAWNIPHVGLRGASERYAELDGEVVLLSASLEGMELRRATSEEIAAWKTLREQSREVQIPRADLETRALRTLLDLEEDDGPAYGAKSANLGEITQEGFEDYHVPAGFGIPIVYYKEHLERHGLDAQITALLEDEEVARNAALRRDRLEALREAIAEAPIDDALLDAVISQLELLELPEDAGVFVRSSTNAEDLPGFNGAGLYDTVPNVPQDRERIGQAIREVWASVWNFRAYEERSFFGIDHRKVYGAVLVQRGINATAAGVLITTDIFTSEALLREREELTRYHTINAKSGLGIRVVEGRKLPEQLLYDMSNEGIKVLSRSDEETMLVFDPEGGVREVPNPLRNKPVLTDKRVHRLAKAALFISILLDSEDEPLDIEWLFEEDTLHVVQVRPYVQ